MSELYTPAVIPLSPGKQGNTNSVDLSLESFVEEISSVFAVSMIGETW